MKMEFSSQRIEMSLFLATTMAAMTSRANQRYAAVLRVIVWQCLAFLRQALCLSQVIVTVPLSLLKSERIRFNPDLPEKKKAAISSLGAGLIEKVTKKLTKRWRWVD